MLICSDLRTGVGCGAINPNGTSTCGRCNNPLRYAIELHDPGDLIGRYRVQTMIGHGGFGAVYAVESLQQPGLLLALKETFDPASIRSLQNEFTILQGLSHPTLPRYYEWFEHQGSGYLVMELVEGQNLEEILVRRRGPLPEPQVLGYAVQLCDVLSYLHTRQSPILHRDIKPANIRLTPDGLIKLVDFGLLKQGTQTTRMTMRGVGTMAYAPIEQYGGDGQHTDQRSDLYSLGATLYHLLSGQEPLSAGKRLATVDPLPPLRQVNPAIAAHVSAAVTKAMRPLLDQRYPDVARFKAALLDATSSVHVPPAVAPTIPIARPVAVATAPMPLPSVARPRAPIQPSPPSGAKRSLPLPLVLKIGLVACIVILSLIFMGQGQQTTVPPTTVAANTAQPTDAPIVAVLPTTEPTTPPPTVVPTITPTPLPVWVPELIEVADGPFLMGSTNADSGASTDEKPQHTLTLPTYWIGKTEVTNAQFRPFVEGDGYTNQTYWDSAGWQWRTEQKRTQPSCWSDAQWNGDTQPVVCVTWYEAMAYTRWLSAQMGQTFSLPTEAEWEKAARGPDGLIYPWGNTWGAGRANSSEAGVGKTTPVGQYPSGASFYGAMDMAGNAWEWTRSVYTPYPYNPTDGREDLRDLAGKFFTLRGGAWGDLPLNLRAAFRGYNTPDNLNLFVGFRLARHL
ncbi:MAG: bifunctional serine/threonine-protein kinase/formylglycine-generating enzyme family protein [Chloroflexales bacterium]